MKKQTFLILYYNIVLRCSKSYVSQSEGKESVLTNVKKLLYVACDALVY